MTPKYMTTKLIDREQIEQREIEGESIREKQHKTDIPFPVLRIAARNLGFFLLFILLLIKMR